LEVIKESPPMPALQLLTVGRSRSESGAVRSTWYLSGCVGPQAELSEVPISSTPFRVGREPVNHLCLDSRRVSKQHAEIKAGPQRPVVCDLGSTNGTFVNGRRIREPTPVDDRDLVQFADREFRLDRKTAVEDLHTAVDYSLEHFWLQSRMQDVFQEGRLRMVFQPIVTGANAAPIGCEALVRADAAGWSSPLQLFEAAEKLRVERPLSEHCRTEAVGALGAYAGPRLLFLNTHPNEPLGPELIDSLAALRASAGERRLVLEIHEEAVPELKAMQEFRAALHDLDIGLAYDDFGIGNSRLLELAQAPPDYLKFDRALVKDLGDPSAKQLALVRTLHHHAEDLGIITLAEGLDSEAAFEACRDIGFTHFQGFLFGRPQPVADLVKLFQKTGPLRAVKG
jgi:EAL domain-containing protein (putative c-di-GMP-specific phosphodiesterase class I)